MQQEEGDKTTRQIFDRQRRNLIFVSIALVLIQGAEITFDKANFLGNTFTIKNPATILVVAWICWGYLSYRYFVYFRQMKDAVFYQTHAHKFKSYVDAIVKRMRPPLIEIPEGMESLRASETQIIGSDLREFRVLITEHFNSIPMTQVKNRPKETRLSIPFGQLWWPNFKALFYAGLHTPTFTEYYLPYGIAAAPVLQWLFGWS